MKKTIIGIPTHLNPETNKNYVNNTYINSLKSHDCDAILIPTSSNIYNILNLVDGILIPGGDDVNPLLYNQQPYKNIGITNAKEDIFEIELIKQAYSIKKPILGICRGIQLINVAFGGTLYQDIPSQLPSAIAHRQSPLNRSEATHTISITKNSILHSILNKTTLNTNTFHHQSIKDLAPILKSTATTIDGIIEAVEDETKLIFAVQFHPEEMVGNIDFENIFKHFVNCCR